MYPAEEVAEEIDESTGKAPLRVEMKDYKDCTLAVMVKIEYRRCRVDKEIRLMRCRTYALLGHTRNHCPGAFDTVKKDCLNTRERERSARVVEPRHADHP